MGKSLEKMAIVRQDWLESERGWGTRPDGCSLHETLEDCRQFVKEYWDKMPASVPDEYSRPLGEPYITKVNKKMYAEVKESDNGVWVLQCHLGRLLDD